MLTKRQKQILDFIEKYQKKRGYSPSLVEIKNHFKLKSVATIHQHLSALKRKGYINRTKHEQRSTTVRKTGAVKSPYTESISLPILGSVNCGMAEILAEGNIEGYLKVPVQTLRRGGGSFALRAEGDSMNRAKINGKSIDDGDFVIVNFEDTSPQNGDYVLSIIDGCANIKKFKRSSVTGNVMLVSESTNPKHAKPIFLTGEDDFMINGKVVAVLKK